MAKTLKTSCCIAGGGPAGILLGYLLARVGVDVVVLEKHADFFRDFRGDTIHASTLEVLNELGLLEEFLTLDHDEMTQAAMSWKGEQYPIADLSHLPTRCKFIAFMPQWDFLNFIAAKAKAFPSFHLQTKTRVTGLLIEEGQVVGVQAVGPRGELEIRAPLTVGADGRNSDVRRLAALEVEEFGVPIDALWLRIPMPNGAPTAALGFLDPNHFMVLINRREYYQCGYLIAKGKFEEIQAAGIDAFREGIVKLAPFLASTIGEIQDWDSVKLLTVQIDRLRQWYRPGLICIGDAAHAMSPAGGVGINIALQDAVATANALSPKLLRGNISEEDLFAIQDRRELPVRITQGMQLLLHRILPIGRLGPLRSVPFVFRLTRRFRFLRRLLAVGIAVGPGAEHVR